MLPNRVRASVIYCTCFSLKTHLEAVNKEVNVAERLGLP